MVLRVRIRDLGPLIVESHAGSTPLSAKPAMVVGMILASDGHLVPVDVVLEAIWPDQPYEKSIKSLDTIIWRLRGLLDADKANADRSSLRRNDGALRLEADPERIDSDLFAGHSRHVALLMRDGDSEHALAYANIALELRRGDFLQGLPDNDAIWHRREQLREMTAGLLEARWGALLKTGRAQLVMQEIGSAIAENPLREMNWELRMSAALSLGRPTEVLDDFRKVRKLFNDELGIDPSPRLIKLHNEALAGAESAYGVARATRRPDRLPRTDAYFVGRSEIIDDVAGAISASRIVTLVGAGGIGKTRLAIRAAEGTTPGGGLLVRFMDLTAISSATDAAAVPEAIAGLMGLPPSSEAPLGQIVEAVDRQATLLILDNCEHAAFAIASFVEDLLDLSQYVHVLATSRRPMGVPGETVIDVPPLSDAEARALLIHRVRGAGAPASVIDDSTAIDDIIGAVGNLPLGIELVASRSRAFTLADLAESLSSRPDQIVAREDAANPRHRSLGAAIRWGYELLSPTARKLFRALGIFGGTFSSEDAAALLPMESVLTTDRVISELVDHSLVTSARAESGSDQRSRFRMLQPIRQFALEELQTEGEARETRQLLARWLSRQLLARPRFASADTNDWNDMVERSWATLRNVLDEVLADDDVGGDIALGIAQFGTMRNRSSEALAALETAARLPGGDRTILLREGALVALRTYRQREAEAVTSEAAPDMARRAIEFASTTSPDPALNDLLIGLSAACRYAGSYQHMYSIVQLALPHLRASDDRIALVTAERILDVANATAADPIIARAAIESLLTKQDECLAVGSSLGFFYCVRGAIMADTRGLNGHSLSLVTLQRLVDYVNALVEWGSHDLIDAVEILATILAGLGDFEGAAEALGAANTERIESASPYAASTTWHDENISRVIAGLDKENFAAHYNIGRAEGARILDRVTSLGLLPTRSGIV
jgi:predicted ATPase/DNA-binding SARP family transcriptional activator